MYLVCMYVCLLFWVLDRGLRWICSDSWCPGDLGLLALLCDAMIDCSYAKCLCPTSLFFLILYCIPHHPSVSSLSSPSSTISLFILFFLHTYQHPSSGSWQSESSSWCRGVTMLRSCCSGNSDWTRRRQRSVGWKRRPWLCGTDKNLETKTWQRVRRRRSPTSASVPVTIKAQSPELTVRKVKQHDHS